MEVIEPNIIFGLHRSSNLRLKILKSGGLKKKRDFEKRFDKNIIVD
jgi:hypothetical protein